MRDDWDHNIQYHSVVLNAVPSNCQDALDVGCGRGLLARKLAALSDRVTAIEVNREALQAAKNACRVHGNINFVEGDIMTHPWGGGNFDLIAAVASLHHIPLRPALARFRELLKPGGVLAIVGLFRPCTLTDFAYDTAGLPVSGLLRLVRGYADLGAPQQEPDESLKEIRSACDDLLPGNTFRRRLLFRYSVVWHKN
jgi:SAM-dependent methyltransferase